MKSLLLILLLAIILAATKALAVVPPFTTLTLAWDKQSSHGTNTSFVLKWGPQMGATNFFLNVGTNLTAVVTNPTSGFLFFHVVARTQDGLESDPSNTVMATNYPAMPLQLRITTNTTTSLRLEGTVDGTAWIRLANITKDPVILAMSQRMLFRTSTNLPPLPTTRLRR